MERKRRRRRRRRARATALTSVAPLTQILPAAPLLRRWRRAATSAPGRRLYDAADYDSPSSEEEKKRERERRKVKLHRSLVARKLTPDPSSDFDSASSTSFSSYGDDDAVKPPKKRRINGRNDEGFRWIRSAGGKSPDAAKTTKATRLPDRNVLEEVLDKLQMRVVVLCWSVF